MQLTERIGKVARTMVAALAAVTVAGLVPSMARADWPPHDRDHRDYHRPVVVHRPAARRPVVVRRDIERARIARAAAVRRAEAIRRERIIESKRHHNWIHH